MKPLTKLELEDVRLAVEEWINDQCAILAEDTDDAYVEVPYGSADQGVAMDAFFSKLRQANVEIRRIGE